MGTGSRIFRTLFRVVAFVCLVWFVLVGIIAKLSNNAASSTVTGVSNQDYEHWKLPGRENHGIYRHLDPYYVSRRRVPNGPDPIHNRRAETTRRPPSRV